MFSLDAGELWVGVASLLFPLWPVAMLMPITAKSGRRRAAPNLAQFLVVWVMLLALRLTLTFSGATPYGFLIPEPLSSTLFYVVGLMLLMVLGFRQIRLRGSARQARGATTTEDLLQVSPREFEQMVVELYTALGHKARRTGQTGDHGVDVVVQAKSGEKWVVQCKRWRGNVGEPVVRDFYGVVHHEKADKGTLITTGGFTPQAREWARGKPLTLVDGEQFVRYWRRAREMELSEDGKRGKVWK